jgi:cytochrome c oxidase subunit IV
MSDTANHQHIVPYKTYLYILLSLLVLTGLSVAVTSVELGPMAVTVALLLASTKSALVLIYFMHLKFDNKIFAIMVGLVLFVLVVVIIITFLDYLFR